MCVIAICEDRRLTEDEVRKMWEANPAGGGVAWTTEDGWVRWKKGMMELEKMLEFHD